MVWALVASVVLVGFLFLAVFPTRTYLAQRRDLAAAERRVAILHTENAKLAARAKQLHSDSEIERIAREQYNLVKPGEKAYAILPSQGTGAVRAPHAAAVARKKTGFWTRLGHTLNFWD